MYCRFLFLTIFLMSSCQQENPKVSLIQTPPEDMEPPADMVWIPGGTFYQGALEDDKEALALERPSFEVSVNGFYMDVSEVTNAAFDEFVKATNYVTTAERPIDWEEMKKELPQGTAKPEDSLLQPGSLLFKQPQKRVKDMSNYFQWWEWKLGVNWRHPDDPKYSLVGKDNHPVVHVSYEDALAYCKWKGRSLPTEAQWEYAAKGVDHGDRYSWGKTKDVICTSANTWTGDFPNKNTLEDKFYTTAPVKSYVPNSFGLYDMSGNVWEWTSDWYNVDYYSQCASSKKTFVDPMGAPNCFNPENPYAKEKVIKGGSFLCNESYCYSFRNSARMANEQSSSSNHKGFRTVLNVKSVLALNK